MLADILIPLLKSRYGGRPLVVGSPPDPVARFPAAHPDVGDLVIYHDDDELTVYLGNFTHVHVYIGEELTEEELSARIHAVLDLRSRKRIRQSIFVRWCAAKATASGASV